mmetsp:Transcript_77672/g.195354  ORF Transcript_77672/g.195354 Transcript_77672/m.195354 type:complete len:612 (+) Transcript_77672:931-2766(+)
MRCAVLTVTGASLAKLPSAERTKGSFLTSGRSIPSINGVWMNCAGKLMEVVMLAVLAVRPPAEASREEGPHKPLLETLVGGQRSAAAMAQGGCAAIGGTPAAAAPRLCSNVSLCGRATLSMSPCKRPRYVPRALSFFSKEATVKFKVNTTLLSWMSLNCKRPRPSPPMPNAACGRGSSAQDNCRLLTLVKPQAQPLPEWYCFSSNTCMKEDVLFKLWITTSLRSESALKLAPARCCSCKADRKLTARSRKLSIIASLDAAERRKRSICESLRSKAARSSSVVGVRALGISFSHSSPGRPRPAAPGPPRRPPAERPLRSLRSCKDTFNDAVRFNLLISQSVFTRAACNFCGGFSSTFGDARESPVACPMPMRFKDNLEDSGATLKRDDGSEPMGRMNLSWLKPTRLVNCRDLMHSLREDQAYAASPEASAAVSANAMQRKARRRTEPRRRRTTASNSCLSVSASITASAAAAGSGGWGRGCCGRGCASSSSSPWVDSLCCCSSTSSSGAGSGSSCFSTSASPFSSSSSSSASSAAATAATTGGPSAPCRREAASSPSLPPSPMAPSSSSSLASGAASSGTDSTSLASVSDSASLSACWSVIEVSSPASSLRA